MPLYDPARHEAMTPEPWREDAVRAAIGAIVRDAEDAFTDEGLWPIHPVDLSDERPPDCLKPLYHGAAGVIWALGYLERVGAAGLRRDYGLALPTLVERSRQDLNRYPGVAAYMGAEQNAFFVGEGGLRLMEWLAAPSDMAADALAETIAALVGDVRGLVWGGAGAMIAAAVMAERTGDARWPALYRQHFNALWSAWAFDAETGGWFWDQDLYGVSERRLGALHGWAANVIAMLKGRGLVPEDRYAELIARAVATVRATAVVEDGGCNWPHAVGEAPLRLQHCMGAPGMIRAMAEVADTALDTLLLPAGELVWRAGPPVKFPSLCHGAAGSGYAFLKLHARTGNAVWLERARAFAMHAIGQAERTLATSSQRKFSLWTGDLGVAVFLWACITADPRFPTIDVV